MRKIHQKKITISLSDILFILVSTLLMSFPASYEPHHFAKTLFAGAFLQSLSYSTLVWWIFRKTESIKVIFFSFLFILFILETFTFIMFGSRFNPGILTLILQTNTEEIKEFFTTFLFHTWVVVFLLLAILLYFSLVKILQYTKGRLIRKNFGFIIFSVFIITFGFILFFIELPFPLGNNTINELVTSCRFVKDHHDELKEIDKMLDDIQIKHVDNNERTPVIVLVIGESFNKYHSSLYGYSLPTSPQLTEEKKHQRLIVYDNAHTPNNGTSFVLKYIFTLNSCNKEITDKSRYVLLPAVFRKAGYRVVYFDNQYTRSSGGELDYSCGYFLNPQRINNSCFNYRNQETTSYDGDFINHYKGYFLKDNYSLNIIHLMGQHFDAGKRYPENFYKFTANDIHRDDLDEKQRRQVAEYDNATLYNDMVVKRIINEFSNIDAVVVYLSDHGEQIYDDGNDYFGRVFGSYNEPTALKNVYEIPFMIWCSDSFMIHHPQQYSAIKSSSHRYLCVDDVAYLLFDLAGIDFNYHCKERSVINEHYKPHHTIYD